jgi:Cof subfamily protein (haloacid dehalogenase superfamily)
MDFSKIKMVVTDMDGTLLNSNHEVSDRFFELFVKLKQKGIIFVAASGRQYQSIVDKLEPIKDDVIVIAENGGFAMYREEELVSTLLPSDDQMRILDTLEGIDNIHPVLCGKHEAHIKPDSSAFIEKLKEYYSSFNLLNDLKTYKGALVKIAIYHFENSEKYIYPGVRHLENDLQVKISGENWVDISSPNANKGYALKKVLDAHKIKPSELMVFGDYNNDLEMLALADFSFAMANAHPNVKKAARYQTQSNDAFGVERILEALVKA